MNLDLEPIKETLSKATPGPWRWGASDSLWSQDGRKVLRGTFFIAPDRDVVENAPRWISLLVDEVETLRSQLDTYRKTLEQLP